jgi:hypothetical protein
MIGWSSGRAHHERMARLKAVAAAEKRESERAANALKQEAEERAKERKTSARTNWRTAISGELWLLQQQRQQQQQQLQQKHQQRKLPPPPTPPPAPPPPFSSVLQWQSEPARGVAAQTPSPRVPVRPPRAPTTLASVSSTSAAGQTVSSVESRSRSGMRSSYIPAGSTNANTPVSEKPQPPSPLTLVSRLRVVVAGAEEVGSQRQQQRQPPPPQQQQRRRRQQQQQRTSAANGRENMMTSSRTVRCAVALEKNLALVARWEMEEVTCEVDGKDKDTADQPGSATNKQGAKPDRGAARPHSAPQHRSAPSLGDGILGKLLHGDLVSISKRLGGRNALLTEIVHSSPPLLPVPPRSLLVMQHSVSVVLHALRHNLHLEAAEGELEAAKVAFRSWKESSWFDPRTRKIKAKSRCEWTIEQYQLVGFSALYAERLHLPRLAAARQLVLWLLQRAPGLPGDAPIAFADLGAGTCAACLGARLALHDHAGDEQPYRVYPIDVASSSARFRRAFQAMLRPHHGRPAALPGQHPEQYLESEEPGITALAQELFRQLSARGERQPHLIIASFSLHYLQKDERDAFFRRLASLATRPLLLLIIKGVGEAGRPPSHVCRSVCYATHYVIGEDRSPRVTEANLCLIEPGGHKHEAPPPLPSFSHMPGGGAGAPLVDGTDSTTSCSAVGDGVPRDSDQWVRDTFAAVERRCGRGTGSSAPIQMMGVTLFDGAMCSFR